MCAGMGGRNDAVLVRLLDLWSRATRAVARSQRLAADSQRLRWIHKATSGGSRTVETTHDAVNGAGSGGSTGASDADFIVWKSDDEVINCAIRTAPHPNAKSSSASPGRARIPARSVTALRHSTMHNASADY